jgi:hypothetical protein
MTSLPSSRAGMTADCMGVGLVTPSAATAAAKAGLRLKDLKVISLAVTKSEIRSVLTAVYPTVD